MEIPVSIVEWKKVINEPTGYVFPEQPVCIRESSIRSCKAIIPEWTTWKAEQGKKEEICAYHIIDICTMTNTITKAQFTVSDIQDRYNEAVRLHEKNKTGNLVSETIYDIIEYYQPGDTKFEPYHAFQNLLTQTINSIETLAKIKF